ncbi:MAG: conserved hypothetical rane protein [Bacteriovoracaceae bacterium]|nr:conserved hypothetical rane protein [Bacteriovoracaceae bacterium]
MKKLTAEFKKKIEQKISELELHTSVEFVPIVARQSSSYSLWKIIYALLTFSFTLSLVTIKEYFLPPHYKLLSAIVITAVIILIFSWKWAFRHLLPRHVILQAVEKNAFHLFLQEEIFDTPHRTGVLILISEFEQAVYILADKGFNKKVEHREWTELGILLAKDFSKRSEGDTFLLALEQLAKRLSADFPPYANEKPRLRNGVREV